MSRNTRGRIRLSFGPEASCDILYRDSFDDLAGALVRAGLADRRVLILTDSNVSPLYLDQVTDALAGAAREVLSFVLPAGKEEEAPDPGDLLKEFLADKGLDRDCLLLVLGGRDLCGLAFLPEAEALKGADRVLIPTSLSAQADPFFRGDGEEDLPARLVYVNVSALKSLPAGSYASGFAKVMHCGLVRDADYYVWLLENMYEILDRDPEVLLTMLEGTGKIRKDLADPDPSEGGEELLDFGKTISRALEEDRGGSLSRGERLALGSVCAAFLSWKKGFIDMDEYYEIRDMFVPFGLSISETDLDPAALAARIFSGAEEEGIPFVLLKGIGQAFAGTLVTRPEAEEAIRQIVWKEDGE